MLSRAARDAFRDILGNRSLRGSALTHAAEHAGSQHGVEPFRSCLSMIGAPQRDETEARLVIEAIEAHRETLTRHLARDPGFSVAAADFLQAGEGRSVRSAGPTHTGSTRARSDGAPFDAILEAELRRCERAGRPLSLVFLEPDRIGLGEPQTLRAEAALREGIRGVDRLCRLLPAGFALLLPCTPGSEAVRGAKRWRAVIGRVTGEPWSAGIAAVPEHPPTAERLVASARASLGLARRDGGMAARQGQGDRRLRRRHAVGTRLSGSVVNGSRELQATVQDLSTDGACVRLGELVAPGARVTLKLRETTPRARSAAILSRVVRSVPQDDRGARDEWRAALRFEPHPGLEWRVREMLLGIQGIAGGGRG